MLAFITAVFIMVFKLAGALVWSWPVVWVAFILLAAPLAFPWVIGIISAIVGLWVVLACAHHEWASERRYRKAGRP
ncbi:hypothetical protein HOU00_gp391 [Caulobacter phage CcrPW]|uniref:Uncharacterized protein n=1 Tax=Caulobacter phage CcrPW TaxID=2283271 RepID=A0A385EA54_9CAUD|nr:hypothetical protein HOU00_gp391 [Caulobacter phage CcrPW]AXQ68734.1 hypothetical protein CcrPW_gp195c [Caulobacter phage CcrPW]